ncbi:MAG: hypothetical protein K8S18_11760 [Desulfobacula sp.]|nr:hypothetical protein [Desulfobacula sp.]
MDFDSIVTFLFIIAFFVLPSIFKQVMARKKKTVTPKKTKKKLSIFNRIGDQIRQFVRDLEEQAKQQKKETTEPETIWETLAEDEELPPSYERVDEDADFSEPELEVFKPPVKTRIHTPKPVPEPSIEEQGLLYSGSGNYRFKADPLQNAVIWSEILSKPLALREK